MQENPEEIRKEEAETTQKDDAQSLEQALAEEKQKAADYLASWQRAQADFINYKRRVEQERLEFSKLANANLLLNLLPVPDDLELALNAIPPEIADHEWFEGVRLVERKLKAILEGAGVTPIDALGQPFDPNFHEAVRQDAGPEGMVIDEYQKGYLLGDKVLRPAKVIVGTGEEAEKEES